MVWWDEEEGIEKPSELKPNIEPEGREPSVLDFDYLLYILVMEGSVSMKTTKSVNKINIVCIQILLKNSIVKLSRLDTFHYQKINNITNFTMLKHFSEVIVKSLQDNIRTNMIHNYYNYQSKFIYNNKSIKSF